jgi:hypothetical protein
LDSRKKKKFKFKLVTSAYFSYMFIFFYLPSTTIQLSLNNYFLYIHHTKQCSSENWRPVIVFISVIRSLPCKPVAVQSSSSRFIRELCSYVFCFHMTDISSFMSFFLFFLFKNWFSLVRLLFEQYIVLCVRSSNNFKFAWDV